MKEKENDHCNSLFKQRSGDEISCPFCFTAGRANAGVQASIPSNVPLSTAILREENWALIRILQSARPHLPQMLCNLVAESTISSRHSISPLSTVAWPLSLQITRRPVVHTGNRVLICCSLASLSSADSAPTRSRLCCRSDCLRWTV